MNEKKSNALELQSDCKMYLSGQKVSDVFHSRLNALLEQDKTMTTHEAVEILLDHAERELKQSDEPKKDSKGLRAWFKSFFRKS